MLAALTVLVVGGCGGNEPSAVGTPSVTPSATPTVSGGPGKLTFTRPDGSTFSLAAGTVSCGPSATDKKRRAVTVRSAPYPTADNWEKTDRFDFEAILDDVASGATVPLPDAYVKDDAAGASMFVYDSKTQNELHTSQEEARGTIVVKRAACEPAAMIEVVLDATLGSEFFEGDSVAVKGSFTLHG